MGQNERRCDCKLDRSPGAEVRHHLLVDATARALARAVGLRVAVVAGALPQRHGLADVDDTYTLIVHAEVEAVEPWLTRKGGKDGSRSASRLRDPARSHVNLDVTSIDSSGCNSLASKVCWGACVCRGACRPTLKRPARASRTGSTRFQVPWLLHVGDRQPKDQEA